MNHVFETFLVPPAGSRVRARARGHQSVLLPIGCDATPGPPKGLPRSGLGVRSDHALAEGLDLHMDARLGARATFGNGRGVTGDDQRPCPCPEPPGGWVLLVENANEQGTQTPGRPPEKGKTTLRSFF